MNTRHFNEHLILDGICTKCARCGQPLSDPDSVDMGIGPTCREKGYFEQSPKDGDEIQMMIDLSEYPELIEFLMKKFEPEEIRGLKQRIPNNLRIARNLMVALVQVISLNRPRGKFKAILQFIQHAAMQFFLWDIMSWQIN